MGFSVPVGVEAAEVTVWERLTHAILPALTLSITGISNVALHTREKMADVMESDYMLFAVARGEKKWERIWAARGAQYDTACADSAVFLCQ